MIYPNNTVIIIPAYNEGTPSIEYYQGYILETLSGNVKYPHKELLLCKSNIFRTLYLLSKETDIPIIVIDDGSPDDTVEEVKRFQHVYPHHQISLLGNLQRVGKGASFIKATENTSEEIEYFITTDADLVIPHKMFEQLKQLSKNCNEKESPMNICEVICKDSWYRHESCTDLKVGFYSGTRLINRPSRDYLLKLHSADIVYDVLTKYNYGLEIGLNLFFGLGTKENDYLNSFNIMSREKNILAYFLPCLRNYHNSSIINNELNATKAYFRERLQLYL